MHPQLQQLLSEINSATVGSAPAELRWRQEGKWCAEEILEHLCLSYTATVKAFESGLVEPKAVRQPTLKDRVGTFVVTGLGYLPEGRTAPAFTVPKGAPADEILPRIKLSVVRMDELIDQTEGRLGKGSLVLEHPILGPFTAGQWRKFHLVHGRHHLKQILKLRAAYQQSSRT